MKKNKTTQLKLLVNKQELEQIKKQCCCGKTVSAYLRETALNMCVVHIDSTYITKHINEISAYRNAVNMLIFSIKQTRNYVPLDLEYIVEKTNQILKLEKEFLNIYQKSIESEKN
ncbi:MAG: plasmid mobilization protein [Candidatus Howiella sp.]|jgi:hypothetical protein